MAVLKEFRCKAHGPFEEMVEQDVTPECPKGCSPRFVVREIRTAPAARNVVTGTLDQMQRDLAHDFGLSDLKVGRHDSEDNKSVMQNLREGKIEAPQWLEQPGHLAPGWSQRKEKPAAVNVESVFGAKADNMIAKTAPPKQIPTNVVARVKAEDLV